MVTIGIGEEGVRIDDSLVVHQFVPFILGEGVELIGFRIAYDLMRFDDLGLTRILLRLLDFIDDIGFHDVVIQLRFAFAVETEPPHLAFHETKFGLISIIFGAARYEFYNVILLVDFTRKVAEVITQVWVGLAFVCNEDDRVGVVVQHTLLQLLQGGIESEPGPTGSETGYKDVKVG